MAEKQVCSSCKGENAPTATQCRFCNERLDKKAALSERLRWDGRNVTVHTQMKLPKTCPCWICASEGRVAFVAKEFEYAPPQAFLAVFLGKLGRIYARSISRRTTFAVPLCAGCRWRWELGTLSVYALLPGLFVLPFAGAVGLSKFLGSKPESDAAPLTGAFFGLVAILAIIGFWHSFLQKRVWITCSDIAADRVTLTVPDPDLVRRALERALDRAQTKG
jgi:ribosomal protein L40E